MTKVRGTDGSVIQDRRGQGGGGGGLFPGMGGSSGFPFPMKAGGGVLAIIVALAAMFLPRVLGAGSMQAADAPTSGGTADNPCTTELEQIVCGATEDAQIYWQSALPEAFGRQYEPTQTVLFSGGTQTGCGSASSSMGPFYCPLDNLVYIDLEFMQQLENQLVGRTADLAEQYIVAHEYGHHVQNVLGTSTEVRQAQQNDPSRANQYSVALELQADCYAGAWVGARDVLESEGELQEALDAAAGVGDDRIQEAGQGRTDPESWTHGSAEQRQTWFLRGYNSQDPRQCTTFDEVL
jgi:uncharacterized protein